MDINDLLAGEQRGLLHARFGNRDARTSHHASARRFADKLRESIYPHRCVGHLLFT